MVVATLILSVLIILTFVIDLLVINSKSFKERFESSLASKVLSVFCAEGLSVSKSNSDHPNLLYMKKRVFGIVALVMCIVFLTVRF